MSNSQRVFFSGTAGRIEGLLKRPDEYSASSPIALFFHSDPRMGGSLDEPLITYVSDIFLKQGFICLSINARGVGKSQGKFEIGIPELLDASSSLDWIENEYISSRLICVFGFSLGSWVALQLAMRRPEINSFIIASPLIHRFENSYLSLCSQINGLILQGTQDSVIAATETLAFFSPVISSEENSLISYTEIEGADHFYRAKYDEIGQRIDQYISERRGL